MKRNYLMVAIFIVALVFLFLVFKMLSGSGKKEEGIFPTPAPTITSAPIEESVKIDLSPRVDKRAVILTISNIPEGIETVEYEITYEAKNGLPKGVIGKIDLKGEENSITREIVLGTCSKNVCVYDENVAKVNLALRFTGASGSRSFQKEYEL